MCKERRNCITQEYLKELFDYKDGMLYWKEDRGPHKVKGKAAGCPKSKRKHPSYSITINTISYVRSRLIYIWHTGKFPEHLIHHKNKNVLDDSIENLRDAPRSAISLIKDN